MLIVEFKQGIGVYSDGARLVNGLNTFGRGFSSEKAFRSYDEFIFKSEMLCDVVPILKIENSGTALFYQVNRFAPVSNILNNLIFGIAFQLDDIFQSSPCLRTDFVNAIKE